MPDSDLPAAQDFHAELTAHLPSLRQQALALTRRRPDADDLVQATVVNALAAQARYAPGTNMRAWLACIMRNRFLSDIRRRRDTTGVEDLPEAMLASAPAQEDNIALGELRRCLSRLPASYRVALVMIVVQGMSYEEASVSLGVAVGTLKSRVHRARLQLAGWLTGEDPDPRPRAAGLRQVTRQRLAGRPESATLEQGVPPA
jgi:RNA polymerase sigma-70 factor, ECF subfamily